MTTAETSLSAGHGSSSAASEPGRLDAWTGAIVFLAFAAAYFCSALVRAITATLSPVLTQDFSLHARDLGLLAGGYFLGFAATQLPLGTWLDRHGPKRVILSFLSVAVLAAWRFRWRPALPGCWPRVCWWAWA